MEPSATQTIARPIEYLLSAISSTSDIITGFIRCTRAAHADLAAVSRDLSDLRLLLELIRDERGVPLQLQAEVWPVLEGCGNALIQIDTILSQFTEPATWPSTAQTEMQSCRDSLGVFRESLSLTLDVAGLTGSKKTLVDAPAARETIAAETARLREKTRTIKYAGRDTEAVLSQYFETVMTCAQRVGICGLPDLKPKGGQDTRHTESSPFSHPPVDQSTAPRRRLVAITIPRQRIRRNTEPSRQTVPPVELPDSSVSHGTTGSAVPRYTEEPMTFSPIEENRRPSPGLPESPTLPALEGHPSPLPQRSLPPPLIQTAWTHHGSLSTRSEPLQNYHGPNSHSKPLESWFDSIADSDFLNQQHPRVTSFASSGSGGRSSGSIQRSLFNMRPVSAHRPDSVSPMAGSATPNPLSPFPVSPPPEYRRTWINPLTSAAYVVPVPSQQSPHDSQVVVIPKRHLIDKGKTSEVLHIDTSPTSSFVATKHSNKIIKIWSTPKNALHGTIKITSYVQPRVRSREYFIRSHAILSENATLIGVTTHFGLTLEIYNFAKGGTVAKKVQAIEDAHRWASSQRDAFQNDFAGLAVYRPKFDRIDRFFLARHPSAKVPFREDPNHSIELFKAGLPFLPKFPELAYSSDSPLLIAAAGPRPGDPPRPNATILIAWHLKPVSDSTLHSQAAADHSTTSLPDEERHKPYRVCVPDYPALQTALPACLAASHTTVVSIWIPASTPTSSSPDSSSSPTMFHHHPSPLKPHHRPSKSTPILTTPTTTPSQPDTPPRLVLTWDLPTNTTRLLAIPPHAQACVSPDCRRLAYCDAAANRFVVVDVASGAEIWRWPDAARASGFASFGQLENLKGVTVFEFSADGKMLVIGDVHGAVGVYEVGETVSTTFELGVGDEVALADVWEAEMWRGLARGGGGG